MCLKESCFPTCWKVSLVAPVFKNVREMSTTKIYRLVNLLSVVSKVFEKLANNMMVDHLDKCGLFPDFQYGFRSSRATGALLKVSCLIQLLGLLTGLRPVELLHLKYPRLSTELGLLVLFTNLILMEFQVRYLALFLLFSVIGSFGKFLMGSFHKSIQLMLEFLKVHSWFYTFPTIFE